MFVGTYRFFAHPKSIITKVGKHLLGIKTGGKMFVGHVRLSAHGYDDDDDDDDDSNRVFTILTQIGEEEIIQ